MPRGSPYTHTHTHTHKMVEMMKLVKSKFKKVIIYQGYKEKHEDTKDNNGRYFLKTKMKLRE